MKETSRSFMGKQGWIILAVLLAYLAGVFSEQQGFLKFVRKHPMEIWRHPASSTCNWSAYRGPSPWGSGCPSEFS